MLTMHCILCIVAMYKFRINTAQVLFFLFFFFFTIGRSSGRKSDEERRTIGLTIESSDDIGMGGGRSGVVGEGTWEKLK